MIPAIRAELRKLLTVRSTYIILGISILIILFLAGYVDGWRASGVVLQGHDYLANEVRQAIAGVSALLALTALLLFAHEYRYNTIMYTLTAARRRWYILAAKVIAVTIVILPAILILGALSPTAAYLGIHLHGHTLAHQQFNYVDLIWRAVFFAWSYAMFGMVFVALIRSQVGAIVVFFFLPGPIEGLLSLLLKSNVKYLPFTSLGYLATPQTANGVSPWLSVIVVSSYLVGAWIVATVLFLRRDAN